MLLLAAGIEVTSALLQLEILATLSTIQLGGVLGPHVPDQSSN